MARATTSFPVPDSPRSSTVTSLPAIRPIAWQTSCMRDDLPTRAPNSHTSWLPPRTPPPSRATAFAPIARPTEQPLEEPPDRRLVVGDEDVRGERHRVPAGPAIGR